MKTSPTNKKIRELISMVNEGKLVPRPEFQRRLVWTRDDKNNFLDTILRKFPFPEIYIADGDVNLETGQGTQLLVDGLQRVNTIIQYFRGDPELKLTIIPAYKDLQEDEKKEFLLYDVAVRDLGGIPPKDIIETFRRLNSTKYSLLDIEVNNAVYGGALKRFADNIAANDFFISHGVFSASDFKRMGDLRFALLIISTMIAGYSNRDESFEGMLDRYNDDFPLENEISDRLNKVFDFIGECGFIPSDRVWRKADLFTLLIELDQHININGTHLEPLDVVERVQRFTSTISDAAMDARSVASVYYKGALQASNDKLNRVRRGVIMSGVLVGKPEREIFTELEEMGLVK